MTVLILDTETTGLDNAEIVEIGIIDIEGNVIMDEVICPKGDIDLMASRVHGIMKGDILDNKTFADIYKELKTALEKAEAVIIYNAGYDTKVLDNTCDIHNLPRLKYKSVCAMLPYLNISANGIIIITITNGKSYQMETTRL